MFQIDWLILLLMINKFWRQDDKYIIKTILYFDCFFRFDFRQNSFVNQIENDHGIRNFAFIGPFPKSYDADSLLTSLNSKNFSTDNPISIKVLIMNG